MKQKVLKKALLVILFFLSHSASLLSELSSDQKIIFAHNVTAFDVWKENQILLGGDKGQLFLLNLLTGTQLFSNEQLFQDYQDYQKPRSCVTAVAKIPEEEKALVAFANGEVSLFCRGALCLEREKYFISPYNNHPPVRTIQVTPDGKKALFYYGNSAQDKGILEIWNLDEERMVVRFEEFFSASTCSILNNDYFIGLNNQGFICSYSLSSRRCQYLTDTPVENVSNLVIEPSSGLLAISTFDGICYEVSLTELDKVAHLGFIDFDNFAYFDSVTAIFWENGSWIFVGSRSSLDGNGELVFYDAQQNDKISNLPNSPIKAVKIFNQNKLITLHRNGDMIGWYLDSPSQSEVEIQADVLGEGFQELSID